MTLSRGGGRCLEISPEGGWGNKNACPGGY